MFCEKSNKCNCHGKYHKINEILFEWYKRCCALTSTQIGVMLKQEAMVIKEQLQNSDSDDFSASDGWLECWKTYSVKERRIVGEVEDVSTETITSWMDRINELIEGYSLVKNIWNIDKSGCFFKALPDKGLVEKENKQRVAKNRNND